MMTNLVLAPLVWPFLTGLLAYHLAKAGLPEPKSLLSLVETTLWASVALFGAGSMFWLALLGMKRRNLLGLWPFVPILPVYYVMMSVAAWAALFDLALRPFHWHKTEHGLARKSRRTESALGAGAAAALARQRFRPPRPGAQPGFSESFGS